MIKRKSIEKISKIFIGEEERYYKYKSGYELVKFLNINFGFNHEYGVLPENPSIKGFPTRYIYVSDLLEELISFNRINTFFNIILDEKYIMNELDISEIDALDLIQKLFREFNRILKIDGSELVEFKGEYILENIDEDLQKIGEGGFAEVYLQKSTGYADVRKDFIAVLEETSALLEKKWGFDKAEMEAYRNKTIKRFENPRIVDNVSRICRTPIRKLGYNERFIKPIRETEELGLSNSALLKACSYILTFKSEEDEQSVKLEQLIKEKGVIEALSEVTELTNTALLNKIKEGYEKLV